MPDTYYMKPQENDQWCWAAVALSVECYFSPKSRLTQCDIVKKVLGVSGCADLKACNKPAKLQDALTLIHRRRGDPTPGPMTFQQIQKTLDRGRPICLRIGWASGGGHFVVLCGYRLSRSGVQLVEVEDPGFGPATVVFEEFKTRYLHSGTWTASYPV